MTIHVDEDDDEYGRNMINYWENYANYVRFAVMGHTTTMKGEILVTRDSDVTLTL
jgi:hypothetical protein